MKTKQKFTYTVAAFVALLFALISMFLTSFELHFVARADEDQDIVAEYEDTNIWDNLQGSTIGGNAFDPADYPHAEKDKPRILSLVEFCYSLYSDNQQDYGLYVYLYNPQDLVFDTETLRNQIQMRCGSGNYEKYSLVFLNYSKQAGYEGRFWKFKVNLTETQKRNILKDLDQNSRTYEISGITLSVKKVATEYVSGQKYTYSGYVKGYGSALAENDTLSCGVDNFDKYVELDVKQTCYRPIGDYYNGKQAQLNSCYFRVPEKYFTDYGELSEIVCEWWEYVTKPILVTETNYLYQNLYNLHGASVKNFNSAMRFLIMAFAAIDTDTWFNKSGTIAAYSSNYDQPWDDKYSVWEGISYTKFDEAGKFFNDPRYSLENFAAVFYANGSYENRYISSDELRDQLLLNSERLNEFDITERYSSSLFADSVTGGHTRGYNRKKIHREDQQDIFWNITTKDTWQRIFGGYNLETKYDSVNAIVEVKADDLKGTDEEIAARLYVGVKDVPSIKNEFGKCKDERLVLFRYASSEYKSLYACESTFSVNTEEVDDKLVDDCLLKGRKKEFTAYIAQETVYLDFDIISLWFTAEDGAKTEIPVVMSPQDVISGLEPPLEINFHDEKSNWFIALIVVILIIVAILIVWWIIRKVFTKKNKSTVKVVVATDNVKGGSSKRTNQKSAGKKALGKTKTRKKSQRKEKRKK